MCAAVAFVLLYLFCLSLNIYQCAVNVTFVFHFSFFIFHNPFFNPISFREHLRLFAWFKCILWRVYPFQIHSFTIFTCFISRVLLFLLFFCHCQFFMRLFFCLNAIQIDIVFFVLLLFLLPFLQLLLLLRAIFVFIFSFRNDFGLLLMMFAYF